MEISVSLQVKLYSGGCVELAIVWKNKRGHRRNRHFDALRSYLATRMATVRFLP
jgi:hypothetical protein